MGLNCRIFRGNLKLLGAGGGRAGTGKLKNLKNKPIHQGQIPKKTRGRTISER